MDNTYTPLADAIDKEATAYCEARALTCTVDHSVVRSGAWRVKIPGHAYPTVLDKDDAHTFANYVEIVNRTTLYDTAKHYLAELAELRAENERMREALQEVYDIYDRKGGVAPVMTQRAIQMVREALNQRHRATMKFKDSYGKVVKPGDTIVIESLYRSGKNEGRTAEVQWNEQYGMFQYKTDAMYNFDDFYGVHRFKKVKP